jgi:hypothetical protein
MHCHSLHLIVNDIYGIEDTLVLPRGVDQAHTSMFPYRNIAVEPATFLYGNMPVFNKRVR